MVSLTEQKDVIYWKWTADGQYSVASAYECQFLGAMTSLLATDIWIAATKPRCKFFACLVLHNRVLTADNMTKRNWSCNLTCPLCYSEQETVAHLTTECNYTEALWNRIAAIYNLPNYASMPTVGESIEWVRSILSMGGKKDKKKNLCILFSFRWQLWKERNRHIFNNEEQSFNCVAAIIHDDLALLYLALDLH